MSGLHSSERKSKSLFSSELGVGRALGSEHFIEGAEVAIRFMGVRPSGNHRFSCLVWSQEIEIDEKDCSALKQQEFEMVS
jgi:hypothetical protein